MKKEVINMKIVKMFDVIEIEKETGIDILSFYCGDVCNDSAISWLVEDEDEDENYERINSYLLAHGAILGEKVWIEISW